MTDRVKRSFRWMLIALICCVGLQSFTGCMHDRDDRGDDRGMRDDHHDTDHHDGDHHDMR